MTKKPMTYNDLAALIATMTPEQRAMRVVWTGDERGGFVYDTWTVDDDQINPSGEGLESVSEYRRFLREDQKLADNDIESAIAEEEVVAKKGQVILDIDFW